MSILLVHRPSSIWSLQSPKPNKGVASTSRQLASTTTLASPASPTATIESGMISHFTTYSDWGQQQQQPTQRIQPGAIEPAIWKLAVAGSLATLISDVSMHPLDCIKTLQQTEEGMGLSMVAAAHMIFTHLGGASGFFKGIFIWGICDAIGGALKFSTYEGLKRSVHRLQHHQGGQQLVLPSAQLVKQILFVFAAIAFVASSVITVPGELLKQHLQMGHYAGCFDALGSILETEGPAGLYSGYDGVLMRDVPYTAMELGLYDLFKGLYKSSQRRKGDDNDSVDAENLQTSEQVLIAGLTGGIAGLVTTPLDTVKTKLMVDLDFAGMSFWDAACATIENHGPEALFCGAVARVAWLIPVTAIYLPTYDFIKNKFEQEHDQ